MCALLLDLRNYKSSLFRQAFNRGKKIWSKANFRKDETMEIKFFLHLTNAQYVLYLHNKPSLMSVFHVKIRLHIVMKQTNLRYTLKAEVYRGVEMLRSARTRTSGLLIDIFWINNYGSSVRTLLQFPAQEIPV